ncbi:MAG: hypothetical protein HZA54_19325 [Planctomycetes bacterium]|nr:hypothetical protein [Planctomycetota bacterium]
MNRHLKSRPLALVAGLTGALLILETPSVGWAQESEKAANRAGATRFLKELPPATAAPTHTEQTVEVAVPCPAPGPGERAISGHPVPADAGREARGWRGEPRLGTALVFLLGVGGRTAARTGQGNPDRGGAPWGSTHPAGTEAERGAWPGTTRDVNRAGNFYQGPAGAGAGSCGLPQPANSNFPWRYTQTWTYDADSSHEERAELSFAAGRRPYVFTVSTTYFWVTYSHPCTLPAGHGGDHDWGSNVTVTTIQNSVVIWQSAALTLEGKEWGEVPTRAQVDADARGYAAGAAWMGRNGRR